MGYGIAGLGVLSASQTSIANLVTQYANQYGVPPSIALGVASHESGFNPNATNTGNSNGTTDWGVMQLNDTVVKTLGIQNPLDPNQNINAGVSLLASYYNKYGDWNTALAAYAAGPGAVASGNIPSSVGGFITSVTGYDPTSQGIMVTDSASSQSGNNILPSDVGITDTISSILTSGTLSTVDSSDWLIMGIGAVGIVLVYRMLS